MSPGRSSRASALQVCRVSCRRPLPSAPSTSASGWVSSMVGEVVAALAVEPDGEEAAIVQFGQRARQISHAHQRHQFQRAGGGFRQHAGGLRAVPGGDDDGLDRKRRGRAQDGADIVRVGDLVEHQHDALLRQRVDVGRGQRIDLGQQPLMHGVGAEPLVDGAGADQSPASPGSGCSPRSAAAPRSRSPTGCGSCAADWPAPPSRCASHKGSPARRAARRGRARPVGRRRARAGRASRRGGQTDVFVQNPSSAGCLTRPPAWQFDRRSGDGA